MFCRLIFTLCWLLWPTVHVLSFENIEKIPVLEQGRLTPLGTIALQKGISSETLLKEQLSNGELAILPLRNMQGRFAILTELSDQASNFTSYSDADFIALRQSYLEAKISEQIEPVAENLWKSYLSIAGKPYLKAMGKTLNYPTTLQLNVELFYFKYPLTLFALIFYGLAILLFMLLPTTFSRFAVYAALIAFTLHTLILALRCYLMGRPPVSNMFETVIYVPWIAVFIGLIFLGSTKTLLKASCFGAFILLLILQLTGLNEKFQNVQAVLDSQYWLIIHVLMVVGSYGFFLVSALLAHIDLISVMRGKKSELTPYILKTLYAGTFLLISGTILGGIWAAESWGRFWDWDPKESWAFITSAVYVAFVHAYRFNKIGAFGLSIGSIIGFLAMSFTWYGVNYVLGTGLHSYGFGQGGEIYYALFILVELIFLTMAFLLGKSLVNNQKIS